LEIICNYVTFGAILTIESYEVSVDGHPVTLYKLIAADANIGKGELIIINALVKTYQQNYLK
jgi:hypothetical protein